MTPRKKNEPYDQFAADPADADPGDTPPVEIDTEGMGDPEPPAEPDDSDG